MKDNGHTILSCSQCRTPLIDIWLTRPEQILKSKIRAKCWQCDGESPMVEVEGGMYLGSTDKSNIADIQYIDAEYEAAIIINQNVLVITSKGESDGD